MAKKIAKKSGRSLSQCVVPGPVKGKKTHTTHFQVVKGKKNTHHTFPGRNANKSTKNQSPHKCCDNKWAIAGSECGGSRPAMPPQTAPNCPSPAPRRSPPVSAARAWTASARGSLAPRTPPRTPGPPWRPPWPPPPARPAGPPPAPTPGRVPCSGRTTGRRTQRASGSSQVYRNWLRRTHPERKKCNRDVWIKR